MERKFFPPLNQHVHQEIDGDDYGDDDQANALQCYIVSDYGDIADYS